MFEEYCVPGVEKTLKHPLVRLLASPVTRGRITSNDVSTALGRLGAGHSQFLGRLPHALSCIDFVSSSCAAREDQSGNLEILL